MSQVMVITVTKADDGSVSATVDSPATTLSSGPADFIGQQIRAIIAFKTCNSRERDSRRMAETEAPCEARLARCEAFAQPISHHKH